MDSGFLRAGFSAQLRDGVGGPFRTRWGLPAGWKGGFEGGCPFFLLGFCLLDTDTAGRGEVLVADFGGGCLVVL